MSTDHQPPKAFQLRIPPELKSWLKHQAIDNHRTLNSEITARLEQSRKQEASHAKQ